MIISESIRGIGKGNPMKEHNRNISDIIIIIIIKITKSIA